MTVMTSGMAHISGGIMAAYILFGIEARHLLTAVIMTAPGTLMMAKIFVPETQVPETMGRVRLQVERTDVNVIDAAGRGTGEGLALALNVGAMLISFLALVALLNAILGLAHLSLQQIFGWVFAPVAWSMGVPWRDAPVIGNLLGTRMALNEFVAYSQLGPLKPSLDPRSFTIATFALCGFANFSSIGIQIGGIGALAPDAASRPGAPRPPCDARGDVRQLHHRDDCGVLAVKAWLRITSRTSSTRNASACRRGVAADVAIVLGSGLGDFANRVADPVSIPYGELPHWPASTVIGHEGRLARRDARRQARRGAARDVSTSTRATTSAPSPSRRGCLARSGVKTLILTNAAGGINVALHARHADGHRRPHQPDGQQPARRLERRSLRAALSRHERGLFEAPPRALPTKSRGRTGADVGHGVYVALHGPSYETPAEIRVPAADRRRRRRHVDRARGDRRPSHGRRRARHLLHHQPGRRRAAAAARSRRGDGGGAAASRRASRACWRGSLPPLIGQIPYMAGDGTPPQSHGMRIAAGRSRRRATDDRRSGRSTVGPGPPHEAGWQPIPIECRGSRLRPTNGARRRGHRRRDARARPVLRTSRSAPRSKPPSGRS